MENENFENDNSLNVENENETLETETQTETLSVEELKTLREKANRTDELEEKNKKLYARVKKDGQKEVKQEVDSSITAKDVLTLSGAGYTHPEDVETIERWAKFNGTSIKDALVDKTLKTVLSTQQEERATALATQSKGGARGVASPSVEAILASAQAGKLPEEDVDKLAAARMARRMEQLGK